MRNILHRLRTYQEQFDQATSPGEKERLYSMSVVRSRPVPVLRIDTGLVAIPEGLRQDTGYQRPSVRPDIVAHPGSVVVHEHDIQWPVIMPPATSFSRNLAIPIRGFILGPNADYQAVQTVTETLRRLRAPEDIRPIASVGATVTRQLVSVLESTQAEWNDPGFEIASYAFEAAIDYSERND